MAKPDKATLKQEGEALKILVAQARKKALNFALLQGKDGMVLQTHLKKNPEMLRKEAKKNGGGTKAVVGKLQAEGKTLVFSVAEEPPGVFLKLTKKHFMDRGVQVLVSFRVTGDALLADTDEDEEATGGAPDGAAHAEPSEIETLGQSFMDMLPSLDEVKKGVDDTITGVTDEIKQQFDAAMASENVQLAKEKLKEMGDAIVAAKDQAVIEYKLATLDLPAAQVEALRHVSETRPEVFAATVEAFEKMDAELAPLDVSTEGLAELETAQKESLEKRNAQFDVVSDLIDKVEEARGADEDAQEKLDLATITLGNAQKELAKFKTSVEGLSAEAKAALTPEQRAQMKTKLESLQAAVKKAEEAKKAAETAKETAAKAFAEVDAKMDVEDAKFDTLNDETDELTEQSKQVEKAVDAKKNLSLSLDGGLLSPSAPNPLGEEDVKKMVAAYGVSPDFGEGARKLLGTTDDRGNLLNGVSTLTEGSAAGFPDKDGNQFTGDSAEYATNALTMGDALGGDYFKDMNAYIDEGNLNKPNPIPVGINDYNGVGEQTTARYMGDAMLDEHGKINTGSDEAKAAFGTVNFHPDMLEANRPAMNMHFADMAKSLNDPANKADCQAALDGIALPPIKGVDPDDTSPLAEAKRAAAAEKDTGRVLVARGLEKEPHEIDNDDVKSSVMSAMFTPLDQGPVGSCFATGPARRVREKDPDKAMRDMAQIATKGTFTTAAQPPARTGNEIPAVRADKLPVMDNQLMRSWEYSIATAGAQLKDSYEQNTLIEQMFGSSGTGNDLDAIKGLLPATADWTKIRGDLETNIKAQLTFRYNATSVIPGTSADGSSTDGNFEIFDRTLKKTITTKEDFITTITRIALEAAGEAKDSETGLKIVAHCKSPAFITAICPDGEKPWEISGGGFADPMMTVLEGGDPDTPDMIGDAPANQKIGARTLDVTKAVLEELAKGLGGDNMISIGTGGMHSFCGLPNDPSLAKILEDPDPAKIEAAIEAQLLDPGKKIAETKMPEAKAKLLFTQALDDVGRWRLDDASKELLETARGKGPDKDMTPKNLQKCINKALDPVKKEFQKFKEDEWKQKKVDDGKAATPKELQAYKKKLKKTINRQIRDDFAENAAVQLGSPQIVIADTNWGDADSHTFFVVIPSPTTGALKMFKKEEPSGKLVALGDDWLNTNWEVTK